MVGEANKYLSDQAPWKLKDGPRARLGTILHVALQVVSDCNTLLTPFLPHSAQQVHELLGGTGVHAPMPEIERGRRPGRRAGVPDDHRRLHRSARAGSRCRSRPAAPLAAPKPVFRKLDPSIVDEELARLAG